MAKAVPLEKFTSLYAQRSLNIYELIIQLKKLERTEFKVMRG